MVFRWGNLNAAQRKIIARICDWENLGVLETDENRDDIKGLVEGRLVKLLDKAEPRVYVPTDRCRVLVASSYMQKLQDEYNVLEQIIWDTLFDAQQYIISGNLNQSPEMWLERLRSRVLCLMRGGSDVVKLPDDPEWPKSVIPNSDDESKTPG